MSCAFVNILRLNLYLANFFVFDYDWYNSILFKQKNIEYLATNQFRVHAIVI